MAELEAVYENEKAKVRNAWRHPLPLNESKRLGRVPTQSDWWMPDELISGYHATVTWDGTLLTVVERTPPPTNRIFYKTQPQSQFTIKAGETFVIGNTVFGVHDAASSAVAAAAPDWSDVTMPAVAAVSRTDLRKFTFDAPGTTLRALEQVADVLRLATDEDVLFHSMLNVALNALPRADVAAIIEVPEESTNESPRATIRTQVERMSGPGDRFVPSRKLADKAIRRELRSIAFAWAAGLQDSSNMTVQQDTRSGTPWAVCTPFQDGSGLGMYISGRLPRPPEVTDGKLKDKELLDCQKVIELIASLIEATRKSHTLERTLTLLRRFLPREFWNETDRDKLDAILAPKQTDVTVLFCDLRGSCRFAEGGNDDLMGAWDSLSDALDEMSQQIGNQEGIVAGFQGDAVMAFWGWPQAKPDRVERAAMAALKLRERFDKEGWFSHFSCGIGIASGPAVAGRLGSDELAKVDVFGPTVNLASRLESLTKAFGARILIDATTAAVLEKADPQRRKFRVRKFAAICPMGMTVAVTPFELLPPESAPGQPMKEVVRRSWEEAVGWYAAGEWNRCRERLQQFFMKDPAAAMMINEMDGKDMPPKDWGGVIKMTSK
ncbi:adenylate/guanylate cyclase domain-containing protein [soil metagenome]